MKKCFVVSPIGSDDSDIRKRSDQLLKHIIKPVCQKCNFEPIRVDSLNDSNSITETILNHLTDCELVIADLTDHNPNVFYEMGYRSALGKPIIHLKDKNDSIPFDVSAIRTFDYDLSDLDSVDELKNRLIKTISTLSFTDDSTHDDGLVSETFNSQILQELFKIQDSIKELHSSLPTNDTSAVSVLADKLATTSKSDPESKLMELLLPTILDNPEKLENLMKLAELSDNIKP